MKRALLAFVFLGASCFGADDTGRTDAAFLECGKQDFSKLPFPFAGTYVHQVGGILSLGISSMQSIRPNQLLSKLGDFTSQFVPVLVQAESKSIACFQKGNLLRCHGKGGVFSTKSRNVTVPELNLRLIEMNISTENRQMVSVDGIRFAGLVLHVNLVVEKDGSALSLEEEFSYPDKYKTSFAKCTSTLP